MKVCKYMRMCIVIVIVVAVDQKSDVSSISSLSSVESSDVHELAHSSLSRLANLKRNFVDSGSLKLPPKDHDVDLSSSAGKRVKLGRKKRHEPLQITSDTDSDSVQVKQCRSGRVSKKAKAYSPK